MNNNLSIVLTKDGSQTIRNESTGDTYHSVHGAVQESQHVFIKNGLEYFLQSSAKKQVTVLEVGLGTALNAMLTLEFVNSLDIAVDYVALEPFPLDEDIFKKLEFGNNDTFLKLHQSAWNDPVAIAPNFKFTKHKSKLEQADFDPGSFDIVYFDAFAPNSQPEMWTTDVFARIREWMRIPSVLTTYCAKGEVRRSLTYVGFNVERLPGPPGKREMIRAVLV